MFPDILLCMSKSILSLVKSRLQQGVRILKKILPLKKGGLQRLVNKFTYFIVGMVLTGLLLVIGAVWYFSNRALPRVSVAGIEVSYLPLEVIRVKLTNEVQGYFGQENLAFLVQDELWYYPLTVDGIVIDIDSTVANIVGLSEEKEIFASWRSLIETLRYGRDVPLTIDMSADYMNKLTASLSAQIDKPYIPPTIKVLPYADKATKSRIVIEPGEAGQVLDVAVLENFLIDYVSWLKSEPIPVPIRVQENDLTDENTRLTHELAESLLDKTIQLTYSNDGEVTQSWAIKDELLVHFIEVGEGFSREKIRNYLSEVAMVVDSPAQNARFSFNADAHRVEEFVAAKSGIKVDVEASAERVLRSLLILSNFNSTDPVELMVTATKPEVTLDEVNSLGIQELLGRGISTYYGSIPTRVHNVSLAAARISGAVVKPGEIFSFNDFVGEISKATGYKEAYVIFEGKTELGDGGGVCQDSTTMFRAALDAGLPIVERKPHSYRVGYYEQNTKVGIDATVYPPYADLKFLNDTPAHILIQAMADTPNRTLTIEIYGTSDGRETEILNHVVWDVSPPPPDVWVDDPTLPVGEEKQIEKAVGGAKAKFDYLVTRGDEVLTEKTFYSTYKPWAAVYLRGTGEVQ